MFSGYHQPANIGALSVIIKHRGPAWTAIPNETLTDARLSFRATGVLAYLLSKPDGWAVKSQQLVASKTDPIRGEGRDGILSALDELGRAGYYRCERIQDSKGHWTTVTYLSAVPWDFDADRPLDTPLTESGSPDSGSSGRIPYKERRKEPPTAKAAGKPSWSEDPELETARKACDYLARKIEGHLGRRPKVTREGVLEMDRLLRIGPKGWDGGGIPKDALKRMIDRIFTDGTQRDGASGFCWADQIQSGSGLRAKWVRLETWAASLSDSDGGSSYYDDLAELNRSSR